MRRNHVERHNNKKTTTTQMYNEIKVFGKLNCDNSSIFVVLLFFFALFLDLKRQRFLMFMLLFKRNKLTI